MSDDHEARIRNLEIGQAVTDKAIVDIKTGIENHREDMKELFQGQERTRMAVVTGINELGKSLPCSAHATKIESLEKKTNGTDLKSLKEKVDCNEEKLSKVQKSNQKGEMILAERKGWVRALDWALKIIIAVGMFVLAIMQYYGEN